MNTRALLGSLIGAVRDDIGHCTEVERLLAEQQLALVRRDADQLGMISSLLEAQLEPIQAHARLRSDQLKTLGLDADARGMSCLLDKLPEALAAQLRPLWQELEQRLQRCQQHNDRNGRVLAGQRELLEQLVSTSDCNDYGAPHP